MVADSQPGHIDQIKQTNAGAVYRLIDQLGPVSRIDLSRFAQLAPASITKIVREMLEAHLVQETEIQEPGSRGRPAVGLMVETEAWHYLSIRISRGEIHLALRDLSSALVVEEQLELALQHVQPFASRLLDQVDQFFIRHQKKLERLTAIAVTMPGIIDTEHGIIHRMPFYEDVKDMPLGEILANHTGVSVYIQHDISAWTMAESLFGASRGARDVIQVVIDHNVGAGVITDGRLLHAGSSSLVEIGHTQVDPYGKRCYCGNHGCLETIASVESVLELAQIRMAKSMSSMLHQQPLSVESLCQAALQGIYWRGTLSVASGTTLDGFWRLWLTSLTRRKSLSALPSISPRIFCFRQYLIVFDNNRYQPIADILPWKAPSFLTGERWLARPW